MTEAVLRGVYTFFTDVRSAVPDEIWMAALFLAAVLQILVPFIPGDAALCATGIVGATAGLPDHGVLFLLYYWLGSILACFTLYELGRGLGPGLLERPWVRRLTRRGAVERASGFLRKHGHWALLVTKFIPGVNSVAVAFAGASQAPRMACYTAMAAACAAHNTLLFLLGLMLGDSWWDIAAAMHSMGAVGLVVLLAGVMAALWGHGRFRRKEGASHD